MSNSEKQEIVNQIVLKGKIVRFDYEGDTVVDFTLSVENISKTSGKSYDNWFSVKIAKETIAGFQPNDYISVRGMLCTRMVAPKNGGNKFKVTYIQAFEVKQWDAPNRPAPQQDEEQSDSPVNDGSDETPPF